MITSLFGFYFMCRNGRWNIFDKENKEVRLATMLARILKDETGCASIDIDHRGIVYDDNVICNINEIEKLEELRDIKDCIEFLDKLYDKIIGLIKETERITSKRNEVIKYEPEELICDFLPFHPCVVYTLKQNPAKNGTECCATCKIAPYDVTKGVQIDKIEEISIDGFIITWEMMIERKSFTPKVRKLLLKKVLEKIVEEQKPIVMLPLRWNENSTNISNYVLITPKGICVK